MGREEEQRERDERFMKAFMGAWVAHYPVAQPNELQMTMYAEFLAKYPIDAVEEAFGYCVMNLEWFPKINQLITVIETGGLEAPDPLIESSRAAMKVIRAVKRYGAGTSIRFEDPVIMAVIQDHYQGWVSLCESMENTEEKWFIKQFTKLHIHYKNHEVTMHGYLPGSVEADNRMKGFLEHIPAVVDFDVEEERIKQLAITDKDTTPQVPARRKPKKIKQK